MTKSYSLLVFPLCSEQLCHSSNFKWISRSFPGDLEVWLLFIHVLFYTGNIYVDLKMFVIFIFGVSHGDTSNSFSWLRLFSSSTYCKLLLFMMVQEFNLWSLHPSTQWLWQFRNLGKESNWCLVKVGPSFRIHVIAFSPSLPKSHLKIVIELWTVIFQYLFCKILES